MTTKRAAKSSDYTNPEHLDDEARTALVQYLERLAAVDADLASLATRFVIDSTGEEVLLELSGKKEAAGALGLDQGVGRDWKLHQKLCKDRHEVLQVGAKSPSGPWVRLAQVFEAAERATGQKPTVPAGWPSGPAALLRHIWHAPVHVGYGDQTRFKQRWSVVTLAQLLESANASSDLLARTFLDPQGVQNLFGYNYNFDPAFRDWQPYLAGHLDAVRETIARQGADGRIHALNFLSRVGFDYKPIVELLVELGTGSAKTVRDTALPRLNKVRDLARPLVEKVLAEGDTSQRHEAAQLLWRLLGADAAETLRRHAAGESSERVRQTIDKLLAAPDEQAFAATDLAATLPPVQIETGVIELPEEAKAGIRDHFARTQEEWMRHYERQLEQYNARGHATDMYKPIKPMLVRDEGIPGVIDFVEGRTATFDADKVLGRHWHSNKPLGDWLAPPGVRLIHLVRIAYALTQAQIRNRVLSWYNLGDLEAYRSRCKEPFGLRELDAAVATLPGGKPGMVAVLYLAGNSKYQTFCDWEPALIWPVFAEHSELLRELLGPSPNRGTNYATRDYAWPTKRANAFRVLAMFPQMPVGFVPLLWDLALGEGKSERAAAQTALAAVPDKAAKIIVALADGRQGIRAAAAEWLGQVGDPLAVAPLKDALRKEKQEAVRGAMLLALEALGADVNEFLNRDALGEEAAAGMAKKRPKGMEWLPLDRLPALYWQDTGKPVDPEIVRWWVVQSIQQKSPVPGPLLRRYLQMCRPADATALARFLLATWIAQDTRTPPPEEAAKLARKEADSQWSRWGSQQYFQDMYQGDKENLYRQLLQNFSTKFLGSAIDQKGMLAPVAAAGDADCVKMCEQYIRKWFGNRLAQCKVFVELLAWMRHPLAIQALLGFSTRFRTKAVRVAAEEHITALAEREGWTIDELADRTIPDAGFARATDDEGRPIGDRAEMVLDYGPRQFTVTLGDALDPVVTTADGKTVKNPPAAAKSDDAEKAKAAKKAFTDAKKVVKEVVKRQTERLYEALCTQRSWCFEDWKRYLADHPVVGKICVRLAWVAFDGERFLGCFRPMEDGSLTNEKDEEPTIPADARVRLAHTCNVPAEVGAAWLQHFADYDVEPPLPQFGRPIYHLPAGKEKETDIKDFEGHLLTTFKLRGKANKLGYVRGDAEDGGCFCTYRKPFPSLEVQAVIGFTGSMLPETDIPAALCDLYFTNIKGDREQAYSWQENKLALGKVPPVLLSECYNDLKQLAAEGTGYDPEWQKRSYF
jgi:HEAT repeat protein